MGVDPPVIKVDFFQTIMFVFVSDEIFIKKKTHPKHINVTKTKF